MSTALASNERGSIAAGALALTGGLMAVGAVLLPWATISAPVEQERGGSKTVSGWLLIDGKILVLLGAIVVFLGVVFVVKRGSDLRTTAILTIVVSVGILALAAYDLMSIEERARTEFSEQIRTEIEGSVGELSADQQAAIGTAIDSGLQSALNSLDVSPGAGLYIALVGGLLGIVGGAMRLKGGSAGASAGADGSAMAAPAAPPMAAPPTLTPEPPMAAAPTAPTPPPASPPSDAGPAQP